MFSLFTYFDYLIYLVNPMFYTVIFFFMFVSFYFMNFFNMFLLFIYNYLSSFFFSLGFSNYNLKGNFFVFVSLFILLYIFNFSSLLPFNFAGTSHAALILVYSFSLWMSFYIFNFTKNFYGFMAHLVPTGTPSYLVFFMFLIELVSSMIRPLTLMVRLLANVLSGHLLMILLCSLIFYLPYFFLFYVLLNLVEVFVSLIQAYIFSTLLVLYLTDAF